MVNDTFNVREGDQLNITLLLDANPFPGDDNFTWSVNGRMLFTMPGLDLGITFIDFMMVTRLDAGNYTTTSTNVAGIGSASFQLIVERKWSNITYIQGRLDCINICSICSS